MTAASSLSSTLQTPAPSPLQVELIFVLERTPAEAFDLMAHRLHEWFTAIHAVTWDDAKSLAGPGTHGACSERTCDFGGKALKEVIVSYEPGRRYSYRAELARSEMKMPLEDHLGSFEFEPVGSGCRVTWRQHFRPRWFMPGALLRWQLGDRLMRPAVERLLATYGGHWER